MHGIYVHIPFCVKKCSYCDFYSETGTELESGFCKAIVKEIELTSQGNGSCRPKTDTVYFGGGTPSAVTPRTIETILEALSTAYEITDDAEITIEVNPGTAADETFSSYRSMGINRLNAGFQSFNNTTLSFLGRIHTADDNRRLMERARKAGLDNIGLDLIYCIPGQTDTQWIEDLNLAADLEPAHMSCYMLTYEHGTPLHTQYIQGNITPAPEDIAERLFNLTVDSLGKRGFRHYEISNFARNLQAESRHNKKYWNFDPYTGFGPSAHSYDNSLNRRHWNVNRLSRYMDCIHQNRSPIEEAEVLTPAQQMTEWIFLGLRKTEGIDEVKFNRTFSTDFSKRFSPLLDTLMKNQLIMHGDGRWYLTRKGLMVSDGIAAKFANLI